MYEHLGDATKTGLCISDWGINGTQYKDLNQWIIIIFLLTNTKKNTVVNELIIRI